MLEEAEARDQLNREYLATYHAYTHAEGEEKDAQLARLRQIVLETARQSGFSDAIPEQTLAYRLHASRAPRRSMKVYKVFTLSDDGHPTALFISGTEKLPLGVWLDAQDTFHFRAKNGKDYVPSTQNPFTDGGKTGASIEIPDDAVRQELIARGFLPNGSSAKRVTALAYRPGWHAGTLPFFPQGGKRAPKDSPYPNIHRYNQVVFECEVMADEDYTAAARAQEKAQTKDGRLNLARADLQYLPKDGFYYYATNPLTQNNPNLGAWVITGSLKINRALTQEECDAILATHGMEPQAWEQGTLDLSSLGYTGDESEAARKTLAPITYDDAGHVIPLSERFNAEIQDVRYQERGDSKASGLTEHLALRKKNEQALRNSIGDDGMQVYRKAKHILSNGNEAVKNAAGISAAILATRAKVWSEKRKKTGCKANATDYLKRLRITPDDIFYPDGNPLLHQALRDGIQLDEKVPILDIDSLNTVSQSEFKPLVWSISGQELILTRDFLALVGMPNADDDYGKNHIIYNKSTKFMPKNMKLSKRVVENLYDVIPYTSVIEISPNRKIKPVDNVPAQKRKAQERKNNVKEYYRLMIPIKHNENIETIIIHAENFGTETLFSSQPVSIYQIEYANKTLLSRCVPTSQKGVGIKAREGSVPITISIRDMLIGVKGSDGKNYIPQGKFSINRFGKRKINLFETADETTFLHEFGHTLYDDLRSMAYKGDAETDRDFETVQKWAEWNPEQAKEYEDSPWKTEFKRRDEAIRHAIARGDVQEESRLRAEWREERFARGFERYLQKGKAPTPALSGMFARCKKLFMNAYHAFRSLGGSPAPAVEKVMARMLTPQKQDAPNQTSKKEAFRKACKPCFAEYQRRVNAIQHFEAPPKMKKSLPQNRFMQVMHDSFGKLSKEGKPIPYEYLAVKALYDAKVPKKQIVACINKFAPNAAKDPARKKVYGTIYADYLTKCVENSKSFQAQKKAAKGR